MVDAVHADLAAREKATRTGFSAPILAHHIRSAEPDRYDFAPGMAGDLEGFDKFAAYVLVAAAVLGLGFVAYLFGPVM